MSEQELASELDRLVDQLRGMSLPRLDAPYEPERTRVAAATALAQRLADAAALLEGAGPPVRHPVPQVSAAAAGDLVAVTGNDVLVALAAGARDDALVAGLTEAVRALRRRL